MPELTNTDANFPSSIKTPPSLLWKFFYTLACDCKYFPSKNLAWRMCAANDTSEMVFAREKRKSKRKIVMMGKKRKCSFTSILKARKRNGEWQTMIESCVCTKVHWLNTFNSFVCFWVSGCYHWRCWEFSWKLSKCLENIEIIFR